MEEKDFRALLDTKEYEFLKTNPRLEDRIMLLGLGGSYAYGTNCGTSDIDFRGITLNLPSDLLGLTEFEQYEDLHTDTVVYSFNKIVKLLLECNPNTIEILGLDEEQYLILPPLGRELLENRGMFLSKRAAKSFGGYASAQLRRLQNALARDSMPQREREQHILNSVNHALEDFQRRYDRFEQGSIRLYIGPSKKPDLETEIFVDAAYRHLPLREYETMCSIMYKVVKDYDKIGKRNKKKDDNHLNKHAMHLIRLFMMAIDILERGEIRTKRVKEQVFILLAVKQALGEGERRLQNAAVRQFIEEELRRQKQLADQMKDDRNNNWEALNRVFLELLKEEQRQAG